MGTSAKAKAESVPLYQRRKLLRAFRKQYKITLVELGKLADVSQPMLSQFERGRRDLSPEALTRVLTAMSNLLTEDTAKRSAEIAKAKETAATLGAWPSVDDVLSGKSPFLMVKSDAQIAKEKAEIGAESVRLNEVGKLNQLLTAEIQEQIKKAEVDAVAELANPETARKLVQAYTQLRADVEAQRQKLAQLTEQGYALFLSKDVEAKDRRIAQLEEQLRALRDEEGKSNG